MINNNFISSTCSSPIRIILLPFIFIGIFALAKIASTDPFYGIICSLIWSNMCWLIFFGLLSIGVGSAFIFEGNTAKNMLKTCFFFALFPFLLFCADDLFGGDKLLITENNYLYQSGNTGSYHNNTIEVKCVNGLALSRDATYMIKHMYNQEGNPTPYAPYIDKTTGKQYHCLYK